MELECRQCRKNRVRVCECSVPALSSMLHTLLPVLGYKEAKIVYSSEEIQDCGSKVSVSRERGLAQKAIDPGTEEVPPTAGLTQELGQDAYLSTRTSVLTQWNFSPAKSLWVFCILLLGSSKPLKESYQIKPTKTFSFVSALHHYIYLVTYLHIYMHVYNIYNTYNIFTYILIANTLKIIPLRKVLENFKQFILTLFYVLILIKPNALVSVQWERYLCRDLNTMKEIYFLYLKLSQLLLLSINLSLCKPRSNLLDCRNLGTCFLCWNL